MEPGDEATIWPIVLFPMNLPGSVRKLSTSLMLAGIIPCPNEVKNIAPYMEIVVDAILSLNGIEIYDACDKTTFNLNIFLHVFDYPGQSKVVLS